MEDACGMAPTVQDGWLVWEVPGKPVSVRLSLDVVSRLGMAVQEGFKALPRRGLEIGGLLIGTARDAGNLTVVEVDDFEPVESEHATGPSYVLSDADRRLLKDENCGSPGGHQNFRRSLASTEVIRARILRSRRKMLPCFPPTAPKRPTFSC